MTLPCVKFFSFAEWRVQLWHVMQQKQRLPPVALCGALLIGVQDRKLIPWW